MSTGEAVPHGHGGHDDHGHVVHVSHDSWMPAILSGGVLLMAFGLALYFAIGAMGLFVNACGFMVFLYAFYGWTREVHGHSVHAPSPSADPESAMVERNFNLGMIYFIASELMFFGAFFGFYFATRLMAPDWPPHPPAGSPKDLIYHVPVGVGVLNLIILLTSGVIYEYGAHAFHKHNNRKLLVSCAAAAIILGVIFLGLQVREYIELPFGIRNGVFGTIFYMLTGFHGAHVIVGVIFLTSVYVRAAFYNHFKPDDHFAVRAAGWYWHFVDVVWIFLVLVLYLWSGGGH